jgi:2-oxo-4-hydroxy-4-carboxy-5-ureidoimidazoline decarboxylase
MTGSIPLRDLNAESAAAFAQRLSNVYEHGAWVAEAAAKQRPFATVKILFAALKGAVRAADGKRRDALVAGHPDLAGKVARAEKLTPESTAEQGGARLDRLSDADYETFQRLNAAYRAKFGFPFIVCVRRHGKDSILAEFERRLASDMASERATALDEIDRIAALRLASLVEGDGPLEVHGRLSTHVLDTHDGMPAAGVALTLDELSRDGTRAPLARAATNADGRTDTPLIAARPIPIGTYELTFAVGAYFAARGVASGPLPFLDLVPVRFSISEPEGHYHVPLVVTPWSYATYRGS